MKISASKPCGCHSKQMNGLGDIWTSALGFGSALLNSGGGGGGSAAPGTATSPVTVSPKITVNPQISPIFQQQFQPSNSPISAGASQNTPVTDSNNPAGFPGTNYPANAVPNVNAAIPQVPNAPIDWNTYLLIAGVALAGVFVLKATKKKPTPYRRRIRHKMRGQA